ncbi:hypothetical protein E1H12_13480 [Geitlerinema sp. P-1104]|uniref:RAMP superfamily CRISPR-associated protein n=1 Tax=Geitlerinema sp. P-1104 TaxID=2546230 RepID=UPI001476CA2A|nr:RAMP superfamily CRISPR-associated protein [Geitlerinema sp. P-1104]NMG59502.1 hypothetical protein [Geitlerinema sp. P-1104]
MDASRVPLAFRAQIDGRCQLQRINPRLKGTEAKNNDAYIWAQQWLQGASQKPPKFSPEVKTHEYQITWRFITNSGQDESIILPVIAGTGCPFYPGSSMKGAFRRACRQKFPQRLLRYCGGEVSNNGQRETQPGILRFHGAYPSNSNWSNESLVDLVHPQQEWQIEGQANHSAFFMMSLFKPKLRFGISCQDSLSDQEWDEIWQIWETALGYGIGSRVSAGYGHIAKHEASQLLKVMLKGEGLIPQRVDGSTEFRPNMFKAVLRGHTLRLLGGVTDAATAQAITKKLWGGFAGRNGAIVGELGIAFSYNPDDLEIYKGQVPPYFLERGQLDILALNVPDETRRRNLRNVIIYLMKFSMMLGGFGKSWRRASHYKFYSDTDYRRDIGCHWEFLGRTQGLYEPMRNLADVKEYFRKLHGHIQNWVTKVEGKQLNAQGANWREAWHPDRVQVWARFDDDREAISEALDWFHGEFAGNPRIKGSHLTGKLGIIGRLWQRMYPWYIKKPDGRLVQRGFIEFVTVFPDPNPNSRDQKMQQDFLRFLAERSNFDRVW